jgi:site-specific DNA-methyltransferase (adenine-specific)
MTDARVLPGDCLILLAEMEPDSVDAIITDPPYHLTDIARTFQAKAVSVDERTGRVRSNSRRKSGGFMGKAWDGGDIAFDPGTWAACHRVLKPGGRLLAFGAPRTHHRIWTAIEDAGFTIEDTIMWLFGQGFPKHKSKLKPAHEPICVARKGPVTALNIDVARIAFHGPSDERESKEKNRHTDFGSGIRQNLVYHREKQPRTNYDAPGRWPANVAFDEDAARALDAMSGTLAAGIAKGGKGSASGTNAIYMRMPRVEGADDHGFPDSGGASRFFYCAKASRAERERGLEGLVPTGQSDDGYGSIQRPKMDRVSPRENWTPHKRVNGHPCVKPLALMRWLVRLVTQPGDLVLDPFAGSGTTGMACKAEGRRFIGIELDPEYAEIARRRIAATEPDGQTELGMMGHGVNYDGASGTDG